MTARMPGAVSLSLVLHGALLALFLASMRKAPQAAPQMVEGVDLLIPSAKPSAPSPAAPKPPPLSTMDFLKMALPSVPRAAAPENIQVKLPERQLPLAQAPKLQDRARRDLGPKLKALDLSHERDSEAALDAKVETRRRATETLAALPRLEDVGRRRVRNLPQALKLEENRREAAAELPAMNFKPTTRREAAQAAQVLQEAALPPAARPPERRGLSALLPDRPLPLEARPQAAMLPKMDAPPAPALSRRRAAAATVSKKAVEIEGPLADRKVAAYALPPFPGWARDQGILEADAAIRFTVDESGAVMPSMRVERTSGYGRLDALAMSYLRRWRFRPAPGAGVQWGVITFRFVLE